MVVFKPPPPNSNFDWWIFSHGYLMLSRKTYRGLFFGHVDNLSCMWHHVFKMEKVYPLANLNVLNVFQGCAWNFHLYLFVYSLFNFKHNYQFKHRQHRQISICHKMSNYFFKRMESCRAQKERCYHISFVPPSKSITPPASLELTVLTCSPVGNWECKQPLRHQASSTTYFARV